MKILSIRIKNLASISEAFIDFTTEPLASTGIFAITGPTGAGKSTILDAMCLALYGKTPRYILATESGVEIKDASGLTLSQGDVKSILMDGTSAGLAEVTFVGLDKQHYRAEWHVKRAREKVTGRLQPETCLLTNLTTGVILGQRKTETLAAIENLIGLNFHQFTRSVLLAQGDFTAFLKADKDIKASLLEKLTGTEIYSEISRTVFEKCKEAGNDLRELSIQMEGVEILAEEELEGLDTEQKSIAKEYIACENNSKKVKAEIQWYDTLQTLISQQTLAEKAKKEASDKLEEVGERKIILSRVEKVQEIKPNFERKVRAGNDIDKKKKELTSLEGDTLKLKNEIGRINENIKDFTEKSTFKKAQKKEYAPLLSEARRLDTILGEKVERIKQIQDDYDRHFKNETTQKAALSSKQRAIKEHNNLIENLEKWHHDNSSRQPIAENFVLINSKLKDGSIQLRIIFEESEKLKDCENKLKTAHEEIANIQKEIDNQTEVLNKINQNIEEHHEKISGISIDELNIENRTLTEKRTHYIKAGSHWKQLFESKVTCKRLEQKLINLNRKVEEENSNLTNQLTQLNKAKIEKEYAAMTLGKAQLQIAENVENLRAQLKDGEECPVCGSSQHPFTLHNPQLDLLIKKIEEEALNKSEVYETILKECTRLKTSVRNANQSIEETRSERDYQQDHLNKLNTDWHLFPLDKSLFQMPEEEISQWLTNREREIVEEITLLQQQINDYNSTKNLLDKISKNKNQSESALTRLRDRLSEVKGEIRSLSERAGQSVKDIGKADKQLAEIIQGLNPFFHTTHWIDKWKANATGFLDKIEDFTRNWTENNQQLSDQRQALNQLRPLEAALQRQIETIAEESAEKQKNLESAVNERDDLSEKRKKLFGGENADVVEETIQAELEILEEKVEKNKNELQSIQTTLTTHETNAQNLARSIKEFEEIFAGEELFMNSWVLDYNNKSSENLTSGLLPGLFDYGPDWIREERLFFEKLNRVIVETSSLFREKCGMVERHQSANVPARTQEELQQEHEEIKTTMEALNYRKNEIQIIFRQQHERKIRFQELEKKLDLKQEVFDKWSKLNELIGSADGKKFRSIAQEYTLDILLLHANHHLEFLSNRYVLSRIPDTLGLQVLDLDMGGEPRTVYSLSGGESFLVSLALALGLASLSSEKMQVESLFIDEGFGALDPQTLDMAMDALDRLHQQGRKVGVISHVQEMKERITTQIQVEKMANGKSKVVIVG